MPARLLPHTFTVTPRSSRRRTRRARLTVINQKGAGMERELIRPDLEPVNDDRLLPTDDHVGEDDDDALH